MGQFNSYFIGMLESQAKDRLLLGISSWRCLREEKIETGKFTDCCIEIVYMHVARVKPWAYMQLPTYKCPAHAYALERPLQS